MVAGIWLVAASLAAGAGTLYLVARLYRYREKPGAGWFLLSLGCQAGWALTYALALVVDSPPLRFALEGLSWGLLAGVAVTFPAFALAYTGRGHVVEHPAFRALFALPVVAFALVVTNPLHGLVWTGYAIDRVAGLTTVTYDLRPWVLALALGGAGLVATGSLLLFDTVVSYGRLYRREAVAVGLSTVAPLSALLVWLFGLGPAPQVNFTTAFLLPHVALDAYAFVRSDMFEFHPATRRAGERAAIEDLGSPVVVVDDQGRVVTLNDAAESVLGVDKRAVLTDPLADHLGAAVAPEGTQRVTLAVDGQRRTYAVTATPLESGGRRVGSTVVLQDVTEDIRREQRLQVLNRVVRHNLRNDMTVVRGMAEAAADETDDDAVREMLDTVRRKADDLVALGEHARDVEAVLGADPDPRPVDLAALLATVAADVREAFPAATVRVDAADVTVTVDRETLRVVVEALADNAAAHAGDAPTVTLSAAADPPTVTVRDDGPGVPAHELEVLESGEETDLAHGTGLGLWLVDWGTRRLGAEVDFDTSDGTTVTVRLPERED